MRLVYPRSRGRGTGHTRRASRDSRRSRRTASSGFSLIEIAVVMVIVGVLAGGGVSLFKIFIERKARGETGDYLQQIRAGLIHYAINQGRFPSADSDGDGAENLGTTRGELPWLTLQTPPRDAYKRPVRYEVNPSLISNRATTCAAFKAGLAGGPTVVDADGPGTSFRVAAVLVSGGPSDADGDGNPLDGLNAGVYLGNNRTGAPNYLRAPPGGPFDDIATYLDGAEISLRLCQFLQLAVNNPSVPLAYVYDATRLVDLGSLATGQSGLYSILSGTRVELRNAAGGGGSLLPSSVPKTPMVLAGQDATITIY